MNNSVFNNLKQETENMVNSDYEKLNDAGKTVYLKARKNKIKKSYITLIVIFSFLCLSLFICGLIINDGKLYLYIFSIVFLVLDIFSIVAMLFELKQPNEKLIKSEIKNRLLPDLNKKFTFQQNINNNYISSDFIADKTINISTGGWSNESILIDNINKKFIHKKGKHLSRPYKFNDIINYEVYENGNSKVKGTAGKALIGGAFFGIGGLIIGSSMGKKINEKCNQLQLIIRLNDFNTPQIDLKYIDNVEYDKNGFLYRNMKSNLQEVCSILEYMINAKTLEENAEENKIYKFNNNSKTNKEQLQELKEMLEEGLITSEEYEQKKKQILGL